jgi:hypothetical protein
LPQMLARMKFGLKAVKGPGKDPIQQVSTKTTPNRTLEQYCQRWRLRCFDVTPAMRAAAAASPDPLYLPRDSHWNVRGNRVAAEAGS